MDQQGPQQHGRGWAARNAEREQGNQGAPDASIIGCLAGHDSGRLAGPKRSGCLEVFLAVTVRHPGCDILAHGPEPPRCRFPIKAERTTFLNDGQSPPSGRILWTSCGLSIRSGIAHRLDDLRDPEGANEDRDDLDPALECGKAHREARVGLKVIPSTQASARPRRPAIQDL